MKRRKVLSVLLWSIGGAIAVPGVMLTGCKLDKKGSLTSEDIPLLDEIGDTILPATASSPGAKAAKIGTFLKVYVTDCYNETDRRIFIEGLDKLNELSRKQYKAEFLKLTAAQKHDLLIAIDKEARSYKKSKKKNAPDHYFTMMKRDTLFGYSSSKEGATKGLRYIQTPGHYSGNVPYKKGDKVWAM